MTTTQTTKSHWSERAKSCLRDGLEFIVEHPFVAGASTWAALYLTQFQLGSVNGYDWANPMTSKLAAAIQIGIPAIMAMGGAVVNDKRNIDRKMLERNGVAAADELMEIGLSGSPGDPDMMQLIKDAIQEVHSNPKALVTFNDYVDRSPALRKTVDAFMAEHSITNAPKSDNNAQDLADYSASPNLH